MKLLTEKWLNSATFAPDAPGAAPVAPSPAAPAASPSSTVTPGSEASTDTGGGAAPSESAPAEGAFDGFGDFSGEEEIEIQEPASVPGPAAAAPAAPVVVPPVVPAPAVPAAAPAAEAPVAAPAPQGDASPTDPASILEGMTTNAPAMIDWLAANAFKLTPEEAQLLDTDAPAAIPKLMARVSFEATKNALNLIKNLVPQLIKSETAKTSAVTTKAKEALDAFYSAAPHLNAKDHGAAVDKWAKAFRASNPKATRQEAIDFVSRAVSTEFNLSPTAAPAAPKAKPFAPARQGARAPVQEQVVENPFAGLGMDLGEE